MRELIEIESEWLTEIAPHYYKASDFMDDKEKLKEKKKNIVKMPPVKK